MITAFIIVGCIVAACTILAFFIFRRSGQLREDYQDDEQCAALSEQNDPCIIAFPNTSASTSQ